MRRLFVALWTTFALLQHAKGDGETAASLIGGSIADSTLSSNSSTTSSTTSTRVSNDPVAAPAAVDTAASSTTLTNTQSSASSSSSISSSSVSSTTSNVSSITSGPSSTSTSLTSSGINATSNGTDQCPQWTSVYWSPPATIAANGTGSAYASQCNSYSTAWASASARWSGLIWGNVLIPATEKMTNVITQVATNTYVSVYFCCH